MAMKGYSTLHRAPELEPHKQIQFSVIPKTPNIFFIYYKFY